MFNLGKILGNPPRAAATVLAIVVLGAVAWQLITTWLAGNRWEQASTTAVQLIEQGRFSEGETALEKAVEVGRQLGTQDQRLDKALNDLAEVRLAQGKLEDVVYLRQESFMNRVARFGAVSPQVASALNELGKIFLARSEYLNAEGMYNQAIDVWERLDAVDQIDAAASFFGRARATRKLGKLDRAQEDLVRALEIQETHLGRDNSDLLPTLRLLAIVFDERGMPADGERIRNRIAAITPPSPAEPTVDDVPVTGDPPEQTAAPEATLDITPATPSPLAITPLPES